MIWKDPVATLSPLNRRKSRRKCVGNLLEFDELAIFFDERLETGVIRL